VFAATRSDCSTQKPIFSVSRLCVAAGRRRPTPLGQRPLACDWSGFGCAALLRLFAAGAIASHKLDDRPIVAQVEWLPSRVTPVEPLVTRTATRVHLARAVGVGLPTLAHFATRVPKTHLCVAVVADTSAPTAREQAPSPTVGHRLQRSTGKSRPAAPGAQPQTHSPRHTAPGTQPQAHSPGEQPRRAAQASSPGEQPRRAAQASSPPPFAHITERETASHDRFRVGVCASGAARRRV